MRPKKVVLCVDGNEQTLSVRSFLLETWGYRVLRVQTGSEALEVLDCSVVGEVDLVLIDAVAFGAAVDDVVLRIKRQYPWVPCLVTNASRGLVGFADRQLAPEVARHSSELRSVVRLMAARKRGPRKVFGVVERAAVECELGVA